MKRYTGFALELESFLFVHQTEQWTKRMTFPEQQVEKNMSSRSKKTLSSSVSSMLQEELLTVCFNKVLPFIQCLAICSQQLYLILVAVLNVAFYITVCYRCIFVAVQGSNLGLQFRHACLCHFCAFGNFWDCTLGLHFEMLFGLCLCIRR